MPREGEESLCEGESLGNEFTSLWGMKAFSEINQNSVVGDMTHFLSVVIAIEPSRP